MPEDPYARPRRPEALDEFAKGFRGRLTEAASTPPVEVLSLEHMLQPPTARQQHCPLSFYRHRSRGEKPSGLQALIIAARAIAACPDIMPIAGKPGPRAVMGARPSRSAFEAQTVPRPGIHVFREKFTYALDSNLIHPGSQRTVPDAFVQV